jgi:mRNA interferase RelE/StbE
MPRYTLFLKNSVEKDLRKIPPELIPPLLSHMEGLEENPIPRDALKLSGADHFYRIRVGDYRIIYQVIHTEHEVTIYYVRHRSIAYKAF